MSPFPRLERQGELEAALQYLEYGLEKAPGAEPLQRQLDRYLQRMGLDPAAAIQQPFGPRAVSEN